MILGMNFKGARIYPKKKLPIQFGISNVEIFSPDPAQNPNNPQSENGTLPNRGGAGYGQSPYGDGQEFETPGVYGENPALVGNVIKLSRFSFIAHRTATWGGTTLMCENIQNARKFVESACNMSLRQSETELSDGTTMYQFWNDGSGGPGGGYGGP